MVDSTMVVGPDWLGKQLEKASPDLLREMVLAFITTLMGAEADAVCGAGYGEVTAGRVNRRNGIRNGHVRFGGPDRETGQPKAWHRALFRPNQRPWTCTGIGGLCPNCEPVAVEELLRGWPDAGDYITH